MRMNDGVKMFMIDFAVKNLGLPEEEMKKAMMETETYQRQMADRDDNKKSLAQGDDYDKKAHMDALVGSTDDKITTAYIKAAFEMHHGIEKYSN